MKSLESLLTELADLDVRLWAEGDKLHYNGPQHVLTPELQAELAFHKSGILAFLDQVNRPAATSGPPMAAAPRDGDIPLSHGQERLWRLAQARPDTSIYNVSPAVFRLHGPLDIRALENGLSALQQRHEILRTCFPARDGVPRQLIAPPAPVVLPVTDVSTTLLRASDALRDSTIRQLLISEIQRPFDLQAGPLWRAALLQAGEEEHIFVFTVHHMIFDGASRVVFLRELSSFYEAFATTRKPDLPDLPVQYADFACWQHRRLRDGASERQHSYWKEQLGSPITELRLPIDHPRSSAASSHGVSLPFELPAELAIAVSELARAEKSSEFIVLLAAFYTLLHRYTDQRDLIICCPLAARERAELESLIGYFNNIVMMRVDLSGDPGFRELLGRVRRVAMEAHENQNFPLQQVARFEHLVRVPLTRCMFSLRDTLDECLDLSGVEATSIEIRKEAADFDLAVYMEKQNERLSGRVQYNTSLFNTETVSRLVQDFLALLTEVTTEPDRQLSALPRFGRNLKEAEDLLTRHPQIEQCVVLRMRDRAAPVAGLVLNQNDPPDLETIRGFARSGLPEYLVPGVFIPLDGIPLTADGGVDYSALSAFLASRTRADVNYVEPRTALERRLAKIWEGVLWLDRSVGVYDDFLDLGGHSLLAVQLIERIETELERRLPLHTYARLTTIAEMAEVLEQEHESRAAGKPAGTDTQSKLSDDSFQTLRSHTAAWDGVRAAPDSLIVGLNTGGTRRPLFWCLQNFRELKHLAAYIGEDQPVYGMRSTSRIMDRTPDVLETLASHYVDEILVVHPRGPYIVGGNCAGARVAFYIARELAERGRQPDLLCLLEKFMPHPYSGRVALIFGAESNRNPYLYYETPELGWNKYYGGGVSVDLVPGRHGKFFQEPSIAVLSDVVRARIAQALTGENSRQKSIVHEVGRQRLPEVGYSAKLTARRRWTVGPEETFVVPVKVRNTSPVTWKAGDKSGIFLANLWVGKDGKVARWLDGRIPLSSDLAPGSVAEMALKVKAPATPGRWKLELDLVDEGVTWFGNEGSRKARLRVSVRRPGWWTRVRPQLPGWHNLQSTAAHSLRPENYKLKGENNDA